MEPNILPELFLNIVDKVNFYWHLYIISVIAVVGWLLSLKHSMRWQLKVLISVAFLSFVVMNTMSLLGGYAFLEATRMELESHVAADKFPHLSAMIKLFSFESRKWNVIVIHSCVDTIMLIAIWSNKVSDSIRIRGKQEGLNT